MQNQVEVFASDAAKAVTAAADDAPFVMHFDVVPMIKCVRNAVMAWLIGGFEITERLIRKHNAPAKSVIGAVALNHCDIKIWKLLFDEQREIQSGGAATYTTNAHKNIIHK